MRSDPLSSTGLLATATVTLIIEHRGTAVSVTRMIASSGGTQVRDLRYAVDGTESTNRSARGGEVKTTSRWEQNGLVTTGWQMVKSPVGPVRATVHET